MVVKVYGTSTAVSPQRVMHCLLEKGVEFELVHVDLDAMQHKTPGFLAKQPFGKVPYIEDGDFKLYESRAIVRYYAAKHANDGTDLLGRTPEERGRIDQWMDVEAHTFDRLAFAIVFDRVILPRIGGGLPPDPSVADAAAEKLGEVLDVYERQLSETKYLAGSRFTLADLVHVPATRRLVDDAGCAGLLASRKHVKAWWEDISGRPAWMKVVELESR